MLTQRSIALNVGSCRWLLFVHVPPVHLLSNSITCMGRSEQEAGDPISIQQLLLLTFANTNLASSLHGDGHVHTSCQQHEEEHKHMCTEKEVQHKLVHKL